MASISSLGVGSNLPLDQLLTDLTKNEKGRLTPITKQQSANSAKNRLWHIEKRIRKIPDGKYRVK
ncbi:flagellar hook associated protein 2 [Salmonella enterica subsp. enterica serovar Typhimurium str. DT104]|nr:flagellar hook associated protein 2 [Salmonella enterica subsp. enterica serovar Typhimurium str. DT104]